MRAHAAHPRPAVSGIVVEDRKPVPNVELFLGKFPGNNQPCTDVGEVIPVSADGRFSWAAVQERRLTGSLIDPVAVRGALTALCIRHPAKGVLIGSMMVVMQNDAVSLRLVCDVARPHGGGVGPHTVSAMPGQARHCEASTTATRPMASTIRAGQDLATCPSKNSLTAVLAHEARSSRSASPRNVFTSLIFPTRTMK